MTTRYFPEVQRRAVRLGLKHEADYPSQWSAIQSVAAKNGCAAKPICRALPIAPSA